jgi:hypothetical protein
MTKDELCNILAQSYIEGIKHMIELIRHSLSICETDLINIEQRFRDEFISKMGEKK